MHLPLTKRRVEDGPYKTALRFIKRVPLLNDPRRRWFATAAHRVERVIDPDTRQSHVIVVYRRVNDPGESGSESVSHELRGTAD